MLLAIRMQSVVVYHSVIIANCALIFDGQNTESTSGPWRHSCVGIEKAVLHFQVELSLHI